MEFNELISRAKSVVDPRRLSESVEVAGVGAAVLMLRDTMFFNKLPCLGQ